MPSWEDIQGELSRKVVEALAERVHQHEQGKITDRELYLVVNSLFDTVSGLVPWDLTDTIYNVRKELLNARKARKEAHSLRSR
ncbi:hypothetical protein SAMN05216548_11477 [Faunimonas pinastri]|uniref:Uncharacterized protein n=1 Tax=Faunimonas pinastri TaxID=1855383 RepID=A0A1H9MW36_9HYPH|nr:hypothetical protein [Faunimonas pinastri]SER27930.1 hypothetical protein SAMN05216548_11477 [Faunimonas pinastri]